MSGKGISKLCLPPRGYVASLTTERNDRKVRFETDQDCQNEDASRARLLRRAAKEFPDEIAAGDAHRLADKLDQSLLDCQLYSSPASSQFMRDRRLAFAGWLWRLRDSRPDMEQALCTIISRHWEHPASDLHLFHPRSFLDGVKSQLRYHGDEKGGYLAGALHSEFVPETNTFRMHLHAIAAGPKIDDVDRMRSSPMLKSYVDTLGDRSIKKRAVKIQRALTNYPDPLTYALQAFAPARVFGSPGNGEQRGRRRRIPEPWHSQYLLWLDQYRLEDLVLLIGVRVTKDGLKVG